MRSWSAPAPVDGHDGVDDAADVDDDGEQEVLGEQWKTERRRRQQIGDEYLQEDDESQEDGHGHGDLFAGGGRQVEDDHAEHGDEHTR